MKSTLLLFAFFLWSVLPAMAQMRGLLKPGDTVVIEMTTASGAAPTAPSVFAVSDQGNLKLPLLKQEIPAAGLPLETLTTRINEAFVASGIKPVPSVKNLSFPPMEACSHVVTIRGEVQKPLVAPLRQLMTLRAAITRAGGFTEFAATSRVKLTRADKETIHDLREIKADGSNNPVLKDGDVIVVPPLWGTRGFAGFLQPGDSLRLAMKGPGDPAPLTTSYPVSSHGTMKFPLLEKEIDAAGVTVGALILRINHSYRAAGIAAEVELSQPEPMDGQGVITVRGGVKEPGEYPRRRGMTLMTAINRAGGMLGGKTKVRILRDNQESVHDLRKLNPDGSNNPILMQGDVIIVPDP